MSPGASSPVAASDLLALLQQGKAGEAARLASRALKKTPRDPTLLFVAGLAEHACGQTRRGITHLKRAAKLQPGALAIALNLGTMLLSVGDFPAAVAELERASTIQPDNVEILGQLGIALVQAGETERAIVALRAAAAGNPGDAETAFWLGTACSKIGDHKAAEKAYQSAIAINPAHVSAHRQLGNMLTKIGRFQDAAIVNQAALRLSPGDGAVIYDLAHALASTSAPEKALAVLDPVIASGKAPPDFAELAAFAAFRAGDVADCIRRCDAVLQQYPGRTTAIAYKGMGLNEIGQREAAAELMDMDRLVSSSIVDPPSGYGSLADFNAALVAEIEAHPSLQYSPLNRSLTRGRSTDELFENPEGAIAVFRMVIERAVARWSEAHPIDPAHPWLAQRPRRTRIGCWANIMDRGGFHDVHFHPPGWLSGVYYPQVPSGIGDGITGHEGWIEFGRAYYMLLSRDDPPVRMLKPQPGMIVLFPSFLGHRTIPFAEHDRRISVAFDVMPV
ncbi:MAG: tetratricopeptide repeat protein [Minwuia sp.]|nr:tetratricopeptide repeat protein [Minwuia sp.]